MTIAKRPSVRHGMREENHRFLKNRNEIFLRGGLDSPNQLDPARENSVLAHGNFNPVVRAACRRSVRPYSRKRPDVDIGPKTALVLGLTLNELATNALKYGALSNGAGYVELAWTRDKDFHLRWHERGGPPVTAPSREGFGSRVIRDSLPAQLSATVELEFEPRGLIWTVSVAPRELLA